jgi:hypothetical protein
VEALTDLLVTRETDEEPQLASEPTPALMWIDQVYSLVSRRQFDKAIDIVFAAVDDMLTNDQLDQCASLLQSVDLKRLETNLLVGLLTATLPVAARLPARTKFLDRAEARLRELAPARVDRLLAGLR